MGGIFEVTDFKILQLKHVDQDQDFRVKISKSRY